MKQYQLTLPESVHLAIGAAIYLKIPPAQRLGVDEFVRNGDLNFHVRAVDPSTSEIWEAYAAYDFNHAGDIILQFWDEKRTGHLAGDDESYQSAVVVTAFLEAPRVICRRIFLQALEWEE